MLTALISVIAFLGGFLLVLSVLVFIHELGHYSVARFFNVAVERFSIGFGKVMWRRTARSGTEWAISAIPMGGYVKFLGDAGAASNPDAERLAQIKEELSKSGRDVSPEDCFHFKPLWQRALIVLAGPIANFLLALALFWIVAMAYGQMVYRSVVVEVVPGAAQDAGVMPGDRFVSMDGRDVSTYEKLMGYVAVRSGQEMITQLERDGEIITLNITPERKEREDAIGGKAEIGTIGVRLGGSENVIRQSYTPVSAAGRSWEQFSSTLGTTGTYIARIFKGQEDGKALGGAVRIAAMTGKTTSDVVTDDQPLGYKLYSLAYRLLMLGAALSIGLGVANLMPIPALDGGHLLFYGYEAIAGRPLSEEKQEFGFRIGFALLLAAFVFLTINDISYVRSIFT